MPERSLARRMTILEEKVAMLEQLPERVDRLELQILQSREEVRNEFSALRTEMREGQEILRTEMREGQEALRAEMRQLRDEVQVGDEETRRFMRVLHEDLVARIAALGESPRPRRKRR